MHPVVAIVGPTASGKSDLAIFLAERFQGEVVNYDSVQIYRHLDIGTAKPAREERQRVPHHMIDIREPTELFTAGDYQREGRAVMEEIRLRGALPVLVGGTGLYLRALTEGLFNGPTRSLYWRNRMQLIADRNGREHLHRLLNRLDPAAASRIAVRDKPKVMRALEVCLETGRALSKHLEEKPRHPLAGFRICYIGLSPPRQELYRRIDGRVERMFERGLAEEVQELLARGIPRNAKPFDAIGYRHVLLDLESCRPLSETVSIIQRDTRRYAKRQLTWYRKQTNVTWFSGSGDSEEVQKIVYSHVRQFLDGD
jgi:tRNA dimethylallyltransferase